MIDFQPYFIWISKNNHKDWMFPVFTRTNYQNSQTKKIKHGNENLKELLGTCIKSKKQHI